MSLFYYHEYIAAYGSYHTKFLYAAERRILRLDEIMFWRQKICGPVAPAGGQRKILGQ